MKTKPDQLTDEDKQDLRAKIENSPLRELKPDWKFRFGRNRISIYSHDSSNKPRYRITLTEDGRYEAQSIHYTTVVARGEHGGECEHETTLKKARHFEPVLRAIEKRAIEDGFTSYLIGADDQHGLLYVPQRNEEFAVELIDRPVVEEAIYKHTINDQVIWLSSDGDQIASKADLPEQKRDRLNHQLSPLGQAMAGQRIVEQDAEVLADVLADLHTEQGEVELNARLVSRHPGQLVKKLRQVSQATITFDVADGDDCYQLRISGTAESVIQTIRELGKTTLDSGQESIEKLKHLDCNWSADERL